MWVGGRKAATDVWERIKMLQLWPQVDKSMTTNEAMLSRSEIMTIATQSGAVIGVKNHTNCDADSIIFMPEELDAAMNMAYQAGIVNGRGAQRESDMAVAINEQVGGGEPFERQYDLACSHVASAIEANTGELHDQ